MSVKEPLPYSPPAYELADVSAIQALVRGDASSEQQQRALNWIVEAAGTYDLDYRQDSRDHAFVSGRRFLGTSIVKMIKLNVTALSNIEAKRQGKT